MITDIFSQRYPQFELAVNNSFFVQLLNIYYDYNLGIRSALLNKVQDYTYSGYSDEHVRILALSMKKLCNELGRESLDHPHYKTDKDNSGEFKEYKIFKNFIFDANIFSVEKISLFEILFRETELHLKNEIYFIETHIPKYEASSKDLVERYKGRSGNIYNEGEVKLNYALLQLKIKKEALESMRANINERLKLHKLDFSYHNGYFQRAANQALEEKIAIPFWALTSESKYHNVELDMLEAIDRYDSGDRDPAFYAAKALESMLKIICDERNFSTGAEKGAGDFISHLNTIKNGPIIINEERDELLAMFRIRNAQGHGAGNKPTPTLTSQQTLKYIYSSMIWVSNLATR